MEYGLNELMDTVLSGVFLILTSLTTYGIKVLVSKIKAQTSKIDNENQKNLINNTLERLEKMVYLGVEATEVSVGKELREMVKDGKIEKEELYKLKDVVQNEVLAGMNNEMKSVIELGVGDVNIYISQLIEKALNDIKNQIV